MTGRRIVDRAALGVGLGFVALYAVTAVATRHLSPWPVRPLFDGFHPPAYRWVAPPREFAAWNVPPDPAKASVGLGPAGSEAGQVFTLEGQALVILEAGAIPAHPPDTSVDLDLTALDATALGPLPPTLDIEGNAYRVTFTYRPSGTEVATLARPATVSLVPARLADHLLYSADGTTWTETGETDITFALEGPMPGPGYLLVSSSPAAREAYAAQEGVGSRGPLFYLSLALVPVVIVSALTRRPAFLWPARARPAAPHRSGGKRRPPPKRGKRRPPPKRRRR